MSRFLFLLIFLLPACKTRNDIRREQELENLRQEMTYRTDKADIDSINEEFKLESVRLRNLIEESTTQIRQQNEDIRKEISTLGTRIQALEQKVVSDENAAKAASSEIKSEVVSTPKANFENAKKLYDEGKYEEATDLFRLVSKNKKSEDGKKAAFYVGECLFASKDFASAVLEYSEFKKNHPKDNLIPNAIYRQANAFRNLGKTKEAKLFYQELLDRFPKHTLSNKAKQELKKLK